MKIALGDLKRLRLPGIAAGLLLALGTAAVGVCLRDYSQAETTRALTQTQRVAAQTRMSKAAEDEREIRENLLVYLQMQEQGVTNPENRLDLIDSIARIKTRRKLFEIRYNIEAQKPIDYPGVAAAGATDFVVSRMKLDMMLLHEEDLLNFISDLRATGKALVSVRHCNLTRLDRGGISPGTPLSPRLRAECQIDLITLKEGKPASTGRAS